MLHESLKGVTSFAAKKDILTPWKEADRARREMTVPSGTPDPALRKGMYHRAYNPDRPYLNASEGVARPHRVARPRSEGGEGFTGSLADHVEGAAWESAEHE